MHLLIYDHSITGSKLARTKALIETALTDAGVIHKSVQLSLLTSLSSLISSGLERGAHTLVVIGNDHLVHTLLNTLRRFTDVTLGIIPFGSGSHWIARMLGIPSSPARAVETVIARIVASLDIGRVVAPSPSFPSASTVPDNPLQSRAFSRANTVQGNERMRTVYFLLGVERYHDQSSVTLAFAPNLKVIPQTSQLVGIYNFNFHAPDIIQKTRPDDGILDTLIIPSPHSSLNLLKESLRLQWGKETHLPCSDVFIESSSPLAFSIDTERTVLTPFSVMMTPHQLRCIVGIERKF